VLETLSLLGDDARDKAIGKTDATLTDAKGSKKTF
jgi:hypothetical protein